MASHHPRSFLPLRVPPKLRVVVPPSRVPLPAELVVLHPLRQAVQADQPRAALEPHGEVPVREGRGQDLLLAIRPAPGAGTPAVPTHREGVLQETGHAQAASLGAPLHPHRAHHHLQLAPAQIGKTEILLSAGNRVN